MANCKICGERVLSGPALHYHCVEEAALDAHTYVCDELCRHLREAKSEDELEGICSGCRLGELLGIEKAQNDTSSTASGLPPLGKEGNGEGFGTVEKRKKES